MLRLLCQNAFPWYSPQTSSRESRGRTVVATPRPNSHSTKSTGMLSMRATPNSLRQYSHGAPDERQLQTFLASHPYALVLGVLGQRRTAWVLDRPRFGAEYVPDFLIGMRDSLGPVWMLVELESPTADPLRKDGSIRKDLHHAVEQVQDYRRWLSRHGAYFREQSGCWGIEAGCSASIVIGRREMRDNEDGLGRIRDFKRDDIYVMSYDRLVENYRNQTDWFSNTLQRLKNLVSSRPR